MCGPIVLVCSGGYSLRLSYLGRYIAIYAVICPSTNNPGLIMVLQVPATPSTVSLIELHKPSENIFEFSELPWLVVEARFSRLVINIHMFKVEEHI